MGIQGKEKFTRKIEFAPAFSKRHKDPNKDYGIGSLTCRFILKGNQGAVTFLFDTKIHLPEVTEDFWKRFDKKDLKMLLKPMGFDVGYHSLKRMYSGQKGKPCLFLNGRKCYYDGSTMNAERFMDLLIKGGDKAVWIALEKYYNEIFKNRENV